MIPRALRYAVVSVSLVIMTGAFVMLSWPETTHSSDGSDAAAQSDATLAGRSLYGMDRLSTERQRYERLQFDAPELQALKATDMRMSESFTVEFEMRVPAVWFDPDQGTLVQHCRMTYKDGECGLTTISTQTPDFQYVAAGPNSRYEDVDYDEDGNLIVWQSMRKDALSGVDFNRARDEQEMFIVTPQRAVFSDHVHTQIYKYAIGSDENIHEFEKFRLATGHGFSKHLATLSEKADSADDSAVEMKARGGFAMSGLVGLWDMVVEKSPSKLVREANFYADIDAANTPTIRVSSYGAEINAGAATMSTAGEIEFPGNYLVEIVVLDYSDEADEDHLAELRERLTIDVPLGAEIVDFTVPIPQRFAYDGSNID